MCAHNIGKFPPPVGLFWITLSQELGSCKVDVPFGALWSHTLGVSIYGGSVDDIKQGRKRLHLAQVVRPRVREAVIIMGGTMGSVSASRLLGCRDIK